MSRLVSPTRRAFGAAMVLTGLLAVAGMASAQSRSGRAHDGHAPQPIGAMPVLAVFGLFVVGGAAVSAGAIRDRFAPRSPAETRRASRTPSTIDLTRLTLAIDWRARRYVENQVGSRVEGRDVTTPAGAHALLEATCRALVDVELGWLRASVTNFLPLERGPAEKAIAGLTMDAAAEHRREVIDAGGSFRVVTIEPVVVRHSLPPTAGVAVVTLIVAARTEIVDVSAGHHAELRKLLEQLGAIPGGDIVTIRIVWSPEDAEKSMSPDVLDVRHPGLVSVGGLEGRRFCIACSRPFPKEDARCPGCGEPGV